jgi:GNAT superfamily N-acetyltransferase
MPITVTPVWTKSDRKLFIDFPYKLHRKNKAFVPPLRSEVKDTLNPEKNPFFAHSNVELFLARSNGVVVGRIAAIIDRNFIDVRHEMVGLFGYFEAIDDQDVAKALFNTASQWLRKRDMRKMLGSTNPSMNDEIGVLMDAFDQPPVIKMVWNPDYYPALYEACLFTKAKDIYAYTINTDDTSERLLRMGKIITDRAKVTFRHVNMKRFDAEVEIFREIYNQAWSANWGFVPWTEAEFTHVAKSLKQVIDPDFVIVAEDNGKPVGFSLALPDLNLALRHINGRLFPFGLPVLLWHARKIRAVRVVIMGVLEGYRHRGIDTTLYYKNYLIAKEKKITTTEMSWILEDNEPMNRALQMMGAKIYKTYRLFEREL